MLVTHFDDLRQAYAKEHPMPIPQIDPARMQALVADFVNRGLDYVETEDIPNRMLDRAIGVPRIARFFLIVGSVLACLYLLRRIWRSRTPSDIPPPPGIAGAPTGPPGVFDRRQKELLRRNNVFEPVRDLVREFFDSIWCARRHDDTTAETRHCRCGAETRILADGNQGLLADRLWAAGSADRAPLARATTLLRSRPASPCRWQVAFCHGGITSGECGMSVAPSPIPGSSAAPGSDCACRA